MARPALRPDEIESFKARLCEAAMQMFAEEGYEAVTLRALAEKLGCSHALPYRYFRDKEEIFAAVCALGFERFADALERAAAGVEDPEQRLRVLARAYFRFALREPHAYRIMFELREPDRRANAQYRVKEIRSWQALLSAVELAVQAGVLAGEPNAIAHQYWAALHGLVSLHLAGKLGLGATARELLEPLMDTLIAGSRNTPRRRPKP
ncbi:MAG TPA: TetR/AcrR family transcriptional regulator [Myxococcota bacterium]|nr:TetR/AcrR family transcriptional regulator [Myxococcota bacterium]